MRELTELGLPQTNREVGAEQCMELAEQRAPDGFDDIGDVFSPGELEALSAACKRTAGFDAATLDERPSLSVRPRFDPVGTSVVR